MPDGCHGNLGTPNFDCQEPHCDCPEPAEHHSQATFGMPGANCRPLRVLRAPKTPFPGHILNARSQL
eukprot:3005914-Pyramimonas_sp.AAC.1